MYISEVHFFQKSNALSKFYDWIIKVVLLQNVSLSGSVAWLHAKKNAACNMKIIIFFFIYLFIFFWCCMQHFSNCFCCITHKKTLNFPRLNFPGACNAAMLHCIHMKMLHRGPKVWRVQAVALMFFQMKKYKFDLWEENLKMMVQR